MKNSERLDISEAKSMERAAVAYSIKRLSPTHRFRQYKYGAYHRGFIFSISFKAFCKILENPCVYCGEKEVGLDRIDSAKGYIRGNVEACCRWCNIMKHNFSKEAFIEKCIKIAANKAK